MGDFRFKKGDVVRIKDLYWYNKNKDKDGVVEFSTHVFVPGMSQFCGTSGIIDSVFEDQEGNVIYYLEGNEFDWTEEMFESGGPVELEIKLKK